MFKTCSMFEPVILNEMTWSISWHNDEASFFSHDSWSKLVHISPDAVEKFQSLLNIKGPEK